MADGIDTLSKVTGLSREAMLEIAKDVKANHAKLRSCPVHLFPRAEPVTPQSFKERKVTCRNCGGWLDKSDAMCYVQGFKAAGGDPEKVWPGMDA